MATNPYFKKDYSGEQDILEDLTVELIKTMGRDMYYIPRNILDMDMLFYGNKRLSNQLLVLPHPEIQNRRFVLQPCSDIIPKFKHPVLHQTINELLLICADQLEVKRWK